MRVQVSLLFVILSFSPVASALVPASPPGNVELVGGHVLIDYAAQRVCDSRAATNGILSTDLSSTLQTSVSDGLTVFRIHLDAIVGEAACPAIDLTLASEISWTGATQASETGPFTTPCGAAGFVASAGNGEVALLNLYVDHVPAACGYTFSRGAVLGLYVSHPHPQTALVCAPVLLQACAGARETTHDRARCDYQDLSAYVGVRLAGGRHGCDPATGTEYGSVDGLGLVTIRATADTCTILLGGPAQYATACPKEAGSTVYGVDWAKILP